MAALSDEKKRAMEEMSDEELHAIAGGKSSVKLSDEKKHAMEEMSDEELRAIAGFDPVDNASPKYEVGPGVYSMDDNTAKAQASRLGASQGLSMGTADEAVSVVRAAEEVIKNPDKRSFQGFLESYESNLDTARSQLKESQNNQPVEYYASEMAGASALAFVPGLGWVAPIKNASMAQKLVQAGGIGAILGAGTSEAKLTKGEVTQFVEDVAKGSGIGLGTQLGASAIGKLGGGIIAKIKSLPEERAIKAATGGQDISARRGLTDTTHKSPGRFSIVNQREKTAGRHVLDEKIIGWLDNVNNIAPKLEEAFDKYGKMIGFIGETIDNSIGGQSVNMQNIAKKIVDYAEKIPLTTHGKKLQKALMEEAENLKEMGTVSFKHAQDVKNTSFKYKPGDADAFLSNQKVVNKVKKIISKEMEETVDKVLKIANSKDLIKSERAFLEKEMNKFKSGPAPKSPDAVRYANKFTKAAQKDLDVLDRIENLSDAERRIFGQYKDVKARYKTFVKLKDMSTNRSQKDKDLRWLSPSDIAMGSTASLAQGIATGSFSPSMAAIGLAAGLTNKFVRQRGSAFVSRGADAFLKTFKTSGVKAFSEALGPVFEAAQKANPSAIATLELLQATAPKEMDRLKEFKALERKSKRE